MPRLTFAAASALGLALVMPSAASAQGLGGLFSCDASGSSNTTGAVVGGLVGGLVGSQISKNERTLGAVIGAGLGAALGNNIGCRMDRKAQQDARVAFERALDTGRTQTWSDPQTGATGRIEVLGPSRNFGGSGGSSSYTGRWRYAPGVAPAVRVSSLGGVFVANSRVNVRAAPKGDAAVMDRLQPGEEIDVAGTVSGGWLAVLQQGEIQGYVSRSVMRPVGGATGECRLVQQTINEPGQAPLRERFNACKGRSGWEISQA